MRAVITGGRIDAVARCVWELLAVLVLLSITGEAMAGTKDIVYIEASTANRWKLGDFGKRVKDEQFRVETLTLYEFDKTPRVEAALTARASKPDAVVVQECSVYFPGDLDEYQRKYRSWIQRIRGAGATPIIATTVPPAVSQGFAEDAKAWIKTRILGRDSQYAQVVRFNEWLRRLAQEEKAPLFDLEKLTRRSEADRHMREDYDSGDGIHLNAVAYGVLDREFLALLKGLE